jgi:UDP-N-acetylmuramoyl-L-alanyl-D-glutamate--2,6-diaminopimelate ligase
MSNVLSTLVPEYRSPRHGDPRITGITMDSRSVQPGDLFVAVRGAQFDGHCFVDAAVAAGAAAVVAEADVGPIAVPVVRTADARSAAGRIAARFFGDPSSGMHCLGVTGTNGKTSVAFFVAALLNRLGFSAGYGGTLGWGLGDHLCPGALTTEDPITVQRRLAQLRDRGATWAALEVSSHALDQGRVDDVAFDFAVFTNLTRDHLDYHGTMDDYAAAKSKLFEYARLRGAVINVDDPFGASLADGVKGRYPILRYGHRRSADLRWTGLRYKKTGIKGTIHLAGGSPGAFAFDLPLFGDFAVANFAAAAGVLQLAGVASLDRVIAAAEELPAPPGRMQFVRRSHQPTVAIDYAHTPDALAKALAAARRHTRGRVICVFGCGGDRDRGKRALMAEAVEAGADEAWITNDNPRSEDPQRIAADVGAGFRGGIPTHVQTDRATAIAEAIGSARASDIVLVAGKGHETYQEIDGVRRPFSDVDAVEAALEGC